jgi:transposase-like protein
MDRYPVEIGGRRFLSVSQVAESIRVSRQTLWRWRKQRKVPSGHLFRDGRTVFTTEEVEAIREYANRLEPPDVPIGRPGG